MVSPDGGIKIARLYDCRRYHTVYGIKVAKYGQQIWIISIWTRQTVVLNVRASVSLECMNFPDGECRKISYGVMKIQKLVGELSYCTVWREGRERMNGRIGRGVTSSLSFCIDNCVKNSNWLYFQSLEKNVLAPFSYVMVGWMAFSVVVYPVEFYFPPN